MTGVRSTRKSVHCNQAIELTTNRLLSYKHTQRAVYAFEKDEDESRKHNMIQTNAHEAGSGIRF
jgi:hypothetical protein